MRVYACKQLQVQISPRFYTQTLWHKQFWDFLSVFSIGSMVSGQFCFSEGGPNYNWIPCCSGEKQDWMWNYTYKYWYFDWERPHALNQGYDFAPSGKYACYAPDDPKMTSDPHFCSGHMCVSTQGLMYPSPMKICKSMWIECPFFKTWTKGHWPLDDLWPHICWGHYCDSTQGSLCPSPMGIHQCMWIQRSILQNLNQDCYMHTPRFF